MTDETFAKAIEVKKDIEFYEDVVSDLRYKVARAADNKDKKKFILRLINYKEKDTDNAKARIIVFEKDNIYGSDIPVEAELLDIIIKYFSEKRDMKKEELRQLN